MNPEQLNKYLYIEKTPTWGVRTLYMVGIVTWFGVIYGYSQFFKVAPIFLSIISPIIIFLIVYHLFSYCIDLFYKQFDLKSHKGLVEFFWNHLGKYPTIDIFLPICGEDIEVLKNTWAAVAKLRYPHKKIYVLDDGGIQEHKALAEQMGFTYMSRENRGHMKKAGNLKHGYERSTGDFIIVYDADFAPHSDFIKELLPYMSDPTVGIVQSYFQTNTEVHRRSPLEYGGAHVQEDFYRFIQVARDRLGAPICCGSNAIYRRKALDTIGGTTQIEHSEDMHTGFDLANKGWRTKYIPIILAVGICPSNLQAYFHQQHRWCSGSLSLMLSKKFWTSKLSIYQKACFCSGFMYYLSHPVTILLSFQAFFLLLIFHHQLSWVNALPFIPCVIFAFIVIPLFRITRRRTGGYLARNVYIYSYTHASITAFLRASVAWQPTNTKNAGVSKTYLQIVMFAAIYLLIYISAVEFTISRGNLNILNINSYTILFWIFYNLIAIIAVLLYFYLELDRIKKELHPSGLLLWRLKTAGLYLLCLGAISTAFFR
jgi:cellulose synthase (UDP-forming)